MILHEWHEGLSEDGILELIEQRDYYNRQLEKELEHLRCKVYDLNSHN